MSVLLLFLFFYVFRVRPFLLAEQAVTERGDGAAYKGEWERYRAELILYRPEGKEFDELGLRLAWDIDLLPTTEDQVAWHLKMDALNGTVYDIWGGFSD